METFDMVTSRIFYWVGAVTVVNISMYIIFRVCGLISKDD